MNAALEQPARRTSLLIGRLRLVSARVGTTLLICVSVCACTTTVRQVGDAHPISQNVQTQPTQEIDEARELRVAQTALQGGDIDTATSIYGRILQKSPDSVAALIGIGNTLYVVSDYTRADVNYRKALALDAKAVQALIGIARVAIQKRRFDDAIASYGKVLALQPNEPLAAAGLGAALDMKGDHAGAQASMREALNANPGDVGLCINLGLSLVLDGKLKEGVDMLQDVAHFPGAPPQARYDLALAYGLMGDDEAAARLLSDLPRTSVDANLRYYATLRAGRRASAAPHVSESGAAPRPAVVLPAPITSAPREAPMAAAAAAPAALKESGLIRPRLTRQSDNPDLSVTIRPARLASQSGQVLP